MKLILSILAALLLVASGIADQRDGSYGVPYLAPDPSLKTTDPFYAGTGCNYEGPGARSRSILPPIFGGPAPIIKPVESWWNATATAHAEKTNGSENEVLVVANSYELTEYQMKKANIPLGEENYL
jgi:hypothetical protein